MIDLLQQAFAFFPVDEGARSTSVDALSTGKSISTNCEPPSGAAAKRTIFIRALRNGALLGAGVAISPRFAALGQAVPPRGKESRDETWRRATLYRCRCWWRSSRHTRIRADGRGDRLSGFGRARPRPRRQCREPPRLGRPQHVRG